MRSGPPAPGPPTHSPCKACTPSRVHTAFSRSPRRPQCCPAFSHVVQCADTRGGALSLCVDAQTQPQPDGDGDLAAHIAEVALGSTSSQQPAGRHQHRGTSCRRQPPGSAGPLHRRSSPPARAVLVQPLQAAAPPIGTLLPFSSPSHLRTALQPPLCFAPSRTAAASAMPAPTSTLAACSATATCGTRHRPRAGGCWDCPRLHACLK